MARLRAEGMEEASVVGRVVAEGTGRIDVCGRAGRPSRRRNPRRPIPCIAVATIRTHREENSPGRRRRRNAGEVPCISRSGQRPGALGARTKRAMAIALSVLARCGPCVKHHVRKAKEEGFSPEEIDEAAWMAIAFGGSPTMMFYNETK